MIRSWGPLVAIGHSGAYRTIAGWLDHGELDHVILLDGFYGREELYFGWLNNPRAPHRRLSIVAVDTLRWTEPALDGVDRDIAVLDQIPSKISDLTEAERRARIHYIKSQYDHMAIVESGAVIPVMLQLTGVAALRASSRER